ncbi:MAG: hypothetical protein KJO07_22410 [Deltaproteobacteria bacterium]|nr:hypothetical protein [Deltaproteobacteria bacterium]
MSNKSSMSAPLLVTLAFVVAGVIIAAISGISNGSIAGGIVAGLGVIPAAWGAWAGMQQETQGGLAASLGLVFVSLGVGAILIILAVIDWIR